MLALALALAPQAGRTAQPAASIFNEGFLGIGGDQPNADLSVFKFGNRVLPGSYMVDVVRDGNALGQSQLRFEEAPGKRDAQPCLTRSMLESWGVNAPHRRPGDAAAGKLRGSGDQPARCLVYL
ncbi:FimD/PapC N-terminal domain-containing protein [Achromobacter xylosoxidans]